MADEREKNAPRAALITGAGRRIGAAIALTLARAGYAVVLHANHSREDAERLASAIAGAGGRASVVLGDFADHEVVRGIIPAAAAFGQLTLLVNNAGEFEPDDIETLSHARFQRAIAVNLAAPLFLSQAFAAQASAHMDASIVNIVDQRVVAGEVVVHRLQLDDVRYRLEQMRTVAADVERAGHAWQIRRGLIVGVAPHRRVEACRQRRSQRLPIATSVSGPR